MNPGKFNLAIYRGDTYRWRFVMWEDTDRTQPADLTGATAKAEIRDKAGGTVKATIDCIITLPNIIDATLDAAESGLLASSGVWDLQITFDSGDVHTVLAGTVVITPDVTDSTRSLTRMGGQV